MNKINRHVQSPIMSLNWRIFKICSNSYQDILMSSLWCMTLHVRSKLIMTFFVKALRVRRAFQMRSTPTIMLSSPHRSTSLIIRVCQVPKWVWCTIQQAFAYVKKDNRFLWEKRLRPKSEHDYKSAVKGMHTTWKSVGATVNKQHFELWTTSRKWSSTCIYNNNSLKVRHHLP